ncbi:MAG: hypothetical protein HOE66_03350 [Planctomycetes bacterium]|nr:hypothetical protein [Planctomycetota bacterium]
MHKFRFLFFLALWAPVGVSCASVPTKDGGSQDPASQTQAADWLALADEAEARLSWDELALCLDRWAMEYEPDEAWMQRRVQAAVQMEDVDTSARYRVLLLAVHPDDVLLRIQLATDLKRLDRGLEGVMLLEAVLGGENPPADVLLALAEIHRFDQRWIEAAEAYERLAKTSQADAARWWQAASQMREQAGDMIGATANLDRALVQSDLGDSEKRSMERLKAFQMGVPQNVGDAIDLMQHHPEPGFRLQGAEYLSHLDFEQSISVFRGALLDSDLRLVRIGLVELGLRLEVGEGAFLYPLLSHTDSDVAFDALQALARIAVMSDVPALLEQLDPTKRSHFRMAHKGLEAASGNVIGSDLDPNQDRRQELHDLWQQWWAEFSATEL